MPLPARLKWRTTTRCARGVAYLLETQEKDGSWYGRWGVNYIYGTFLAMRGLGRPAIPGASKAMRKARQVAALGAESRTAGGARPAPATTRTGSCPRRAAPSQTAWALLGLVAAGQGETEALARGVRYLLDTQKPDGTWPDESLATGTGFPNVFYLRYAMYRDYFPLLALTHARRALEEAERSLRLVQESEPSRPIR